MNVRLPPLYYELALDHAPIHIIFTDPDGIIQFANPAVSRITGYSHKEIIGKRPSLWGGQMPKTFYKKLWHTIKDERRPYHGKIINQRKNGEIYDAEVWIAPVLDPDGKLIGFIGIEQDITLVTALVEELEESREQFEEIANNIEDVFFLFDVRKRQFIYASPAYRDMWGLDIEDITAEPEAWLKVLVKQDALKVQKMILQTLRKRSVEEQIRVKHPDGKVRHIRFHTWPILDARGKVTRAAGIARNVTEAMEAEKTLLDILEGSLTGTMLVQDGAIAYVNKAVLDMFGYKDEKGLIGKPLTAVATEQGYEAILASDYETRSTGKKSESVRYVFEAKKKDGTSFMAEVLSNPTVYKGRPALVGSLIDVTEREHAREKEAELLQLKDKFIKIVSHQMRTPLNSIRWNLESLATDGVGKLTEAQSEFVRLTLDQTVGIIDRVGDLLLAMDISEGHMHLQTEVVSLESLVASEVRRYQKICELREIGCEYKKPRFDLRGMEVDPEKIRLVLSKLLDNAVQYSDKGGRVTVKAGVSGGKVKITVEDKGIGIPAEEQPHIFEMFYRGSNAHLLLPDASGLGLFIAKTIVEAHGGKIGFKSKEGKGSAFWIELPVRRGIFRT